MVFAFPACCNPEGDGLSPMRIWQYRSAMLWALVLGCGAAMVLLVSPDLGAQCQMCRTALTQSSEGQRWSRGINAGILLLLAAPFLIAGSALLVIFHAQLRRMVKRMRARIFAPETRSEGRAAYPPLSDR
jgi:hypothetical protein